MDGVAGTLGGAVEQITAGLARVDDAAFVRASDRELLAAVPVLESLTARLEWVRAHVVGEVDARGLATEAGACSTPAWLAGVSRAHPGSTSRLVGLARALPR
ncbi:MAG TPA: hypothetical protein VLC50_07415, partial [Actinomycetes bacterium]|nr:hypothetical protein [Actinomycetes bacterium]